MTDNIKKGIEAAKNEKETITLELNKYKTDFSQSLLDHKEDIIESINHPYVPTKKDKRKYRWMQFKNNLKRALGI